MPDEPELLTAGEVVSLQRAPTQKVPCYTDALQGKLTRAGHRVTSGIFEYACGKYHFTAGISLRVEADHNLPSLNRRKGCNPC